VGLDGALPYKEMRGKLCVALSGGELVAAVKLAPPVSVRVTWPMSGRGPSERGPPTTTSRPLTVPTGPSPPPVPPPITPTPIAMTLSKVAVR
jgi:hypothetical protein